MNTQDYGFATITFTNQITTHNVTLPFTFEVKVNSLDPSELAWEAAAEWPESGWDNDVPVWSVIKVTATVDGITTNITPVN